MQDNALYLLGKRMPARIIPVKDLKAPLVSDDRQYYAGLIGLNFVGTEGLDLNHNRIIPEKILIQDSMKDEVRVDKTEGIALVFSRLSSEEMISNFAAKYGFLDLIEYLPYPIPEDLNGVPEAYTLPYFESLDAWYFQINVIRHLVMIYAALRDDNIALLQEMSYPFFPPPYRSNVAGEDKGLIDRATKYLIEYILNNLEGRIYLDYHMLGAVTDDAPLKRKIVEKKATQCLLAVIYYDLWRMITAEKKVYFCEYCGAPIDKVRRQKFCNQSCKQADYRQRQKDKSRNK
jgi:hypothetical protein